MKLYGIKNCDTVKKACRFLDAKGVTYEFVDLKTTPLSDEQLKVWLQNPALINKRSSTYRQIKAEIEACQSEVELIKIIQANPTVLKRPIIVKDDTLVIGFAEQTYREQLL